MTMLSAVAKGCTRETSEADPNDSWDRPDTVFDLEEVYVELAPEGAQHVGMFDEHFEVDGVGPGDTVHVVYAAYSTGDTFGNDDGQITFMDIFTDEAKAERLAAALREVKDYDLSFEGTDYYIPFNGYFESLEGVKVMTLVIRK